MSKSAQDKLLLLVASFCQTPNDWLDVFSSPLPRLPGFPKRDKTIKTAITSLIQKELIEYKKKGNSILIKPSIKAFSDLSRDYPVFYQFVGSWDGLFRIVMYNVPEGERKKRDALRWIIKKFHFVQFEKSVWISPHDLIDPLTDSLSKLNVKVNIFTARLSFGNTKGLVNQTWRMSAINDQYGKVIKILKAVKKSSSRRSKIEVFRKAYLLYLETLTSDPGLPQKLLPAAWGGIKVRGELVKLQKQL